MSNNRTSNILYIKNSIFIIWTLIWSFITIVFLSNFIGLVFSICSIGVVILLLYFPVKKYLKEKKFNVSLTNFLVSLCGSIGLSFSIWHLITIYEFVPALVNSILFLVSFSLMILPFLMIIYLLLNCERFDKNYKIDKIIFAIPIILAFAFFFLIQPISIYLNNIEEIPFSFKYLLYSELFFFSFLLVILYIYYILPKKVYLYISVLFSFLLIASYLQLIIFNKYLGIIIGGKYNWKSHSFYSIFNLLLWIIVLFALILVINFKKYNRIVVFLCIAIIVMLFSGLIADFIRVRSSASINKDDNMHYYLSTDEQFAVGKENIIILIADAVDNSFVKEILDSDPAFFDEFNDFTLYTNTCSVYDYTAHSVQQMIYGYTFKDGTEKTIPFLERLKKNNYRVLTFSYNLVNAPGKPDDYIDNYIYSDKAVLIRKDRIRSNFSKVTALQLLPCIFKQFSNAETTNFDNCLDTNFVTRNTLSNNKEFDKNLSLRINEKSDKCFIYQHIDGAHYPSDDYISDTKISLNIFKKYISQLKELGVYDNSVIIIAADHGVHDGVEGVPFPTAATPMFIIKGKNEKHDTICISNKPIYYQDIQATIIKYAELNEVGDEELFGKTIDDFGENEIRTRVWFDSNASFSDTYKYTFTGDTSELERVVRENNYQVVDDYSFDYKDLK